MLKHRSVLLLVSSVLYFLSFPPFWSGILSYLCLVPFLFAVRDLRWTAGFRLGYTFGLCSLGGLLYWLAWNSGATWIQAAGLYVLCVLYLSLAWGLFGLMQSAAFRRFGEKGVWAAPALWTALEFVQSRGELGFSWHSLATTQTYYTPAIQFISVTGMYGLTFWIVTANVMIYGWVRQFIDGSMENVPAGRSIVLVAWILVPWIVGWSVLPDTPQVGSKELSVFIVQPNIEPNRKWLERNFAYREIMKLTREAPSQAVDLVVWPETAIPNRLRQEKTRLEEIREELQRRRTCLLTGIPDRRWMTRRDGSSGFGSFNSVFLIRPDREEFQAYDKMHLVPFGEHVPSFLTALEKLAMEVGVPDYSAGAEATVFSLPLFGDTLQKDSVRFAAVVCLESVFAHMVRDAVVRGAQFLVIVTNDAWYDGTFGPVQHAQIAVLRAVENRIAVVRSANSGISSIIDPYGRVVRQSRNAEQVVLAGSIGTSDETGTFFSRHGSWWGWLMVGVASIIVLGTGFPRGKAEASDDRR
jgi:apolipoprotein N-acyltransferase